MRKISKRYIFFLAVIAAIPSLSTDMYLAAIPKISSVWNESISTVNLSLTLWFIAFSISLLVAGTLSDKFGRRPVLRIGIGCFVISSLLCSFSTSITQLIIFRIIQGMSAACPASMSLAICRDKFTGSRRKVALAYVGIILALTPMLSPSIGSLVLYVGSWREIFIIQGLTGLFPFWLCLRYTETNRKKISGGIKELFGRYPLLLKNSSYIKAIFILTFTTGPFLGFVAFAPVVYITYYKLSDFHFSLLFALNALCSMTGSFLFTKFGEKFNDSTFISFSFICGIVAGIGLVVFGKFSPYCFLGFFCMFTFFFGMSRPVSNNLVLNQVKTDIGSASSLLICYQFVVGACSMSYTTFGWKDPVFMFAVFTLVMSIIPLIFWFIMKKGILK